MSPTNSSLDPLHFDTKQHIKSNVSPGTPPMMSSTYKEMTNLALAKASKTSETDKLRKPTNSTSSDSSLGKTVTTPERHEQLTLMDLKLIDTKPYIQSPGQRKMFFHLCYSCCLKSSCKGFLNGWTRSEANVDVFVTQNFFDNPNCLWSAKLFW